MSGFQDYSEYYDLLYEDKDTAAEVAYVEALLNRHSSGARSVLEFGCGTGRHAELLCANGRLVHGIDRSESMLRRAEKRITEANRDRLSFEVGDIRRLRLGREFDAVVSLFHVISYQTTDDDVAAAFASARAHLNPSGVFVFDCWYGPAVLWTKPSIRVRAVEDDAFKVTRIAVPSMDTGRNVVHVDYQLFVHDKRSGAIEEINERHDVRYFFQPEIVRLFHDHGFEFLASEEWLSGADPDVSAWGVCFVGRAK